MLKNVSVWYNVFSTMFVSYLVQATEIKRELNDLYLQVCNDLYLQVVILCSYA